MNAIRIPLWMNLLSVALTVLIVYLMARWGRPKSNRATREGMVVELKEENLPGEPPFKKAA
jgi:hypothetical protein